MLTEMNNRILMQWAPSIFTHCFDLGFRHHSAFTLIKSKKHTTILMLMEVVNIESEDNYNTLIIRGKILLDIIGRWCERVTCSKVDKQISLERIARISVTNGKLNYSCGNNVRVRLFCMRIVNGNTQDIY